VCCTKYFFSFQNINNFVEYFLFFYIRNGETPQGEDMDQSEAKEGNLSENTSEPLPPQPTRKKKKTENQHLEKAPELLRDVQTKL
jgi:hypothetical protein